LALLVVARAIKIRHPAFGGDRVEARRQPMSERELPAMAEVEEPGLYAGVRATESQALGEEAINLLFEKHRLNRIA